MTVPAGPFACRRVVRQGAGRFGSSRVLPLTGVDRGLKDDLLKEHLEMAEFFCYYMRCSGVVGV
ncbi:MAG: hypothetical protein V3V94_05015 [Candidatus Brocadiales bacterium]